MLVVSEGNVALGIINVSNPLTPAYFWLIPHQAVTALVTAAIGLGKLDQTLKF
jgi:hypothetical protein